MHLEFRIGLYIFGFGTYMYKSTQADLPNYARCFYRRKTLTDSAPIDSFDYVFAAVICLCSKHEIERII